MNGKTYTLAMYRVQPGQEDAFVAAWRELAKTFSSLAAPPLWGTLIRNTKDLALFYSFGPWRDPADVQSMRTDPSAHEAFQQLAALCIEMTPGDYQVIEDVEVAQPIRD